MKNKKKTNFFLFYLRGDIWKDTEEKAQTSISFTAVHLQGLVKASYDTIRNRKVFLGILRGFDCFRFWRNLVWNRRVLHGGLLSIALHFPFRWFQSKGQSSLRDFRHTDNIFRAWILTSRKIIECTEQSSDSKKKNSFFLLLIFLFQWDKKWSTFSRLQNYFRTSELWLWWPSIQPSVEGWGS